MPPLRQYLNVVRNFESLNNMPRDNFYTYTGLLSLVVVLVGLVLWGKKADRAAEKKCQVERALQFEGVISNYQTDIESETSTFNLDSDNALYKIPRSSKELLLDDRDTIKKITGENSYIVRHNSGLWIHHIDTFKFECPDR
jgi:hypothetical protein